MDKLKQFQEKIIAKKDYIIKIVLAFLGTYGLCHTMELSGSQRFSFSAFSVMLFVGMYWLLQQVEKELQEIIDEKARKRRIRFVLLVSFLFSITMIMGYQLQNNGMMDYGFKGKGMIIVRGACLSIFAFPFVNFLFGLVDKLQNITLEYKGKPWDVKKVFFGSWITILVCWIPVWLAYYPTIMSYDFHRQAQEAMNGFEWFIPHHPLAHTWLIWLFLKIGEGIGSYEIGLALFQWFQMLICTAVMGYSCNMLYRVTKRKWVVTLALLFYGVFPFVTVQSMCTTKDVLFSAFFLLFFLLIVERTFLSTGKSNRKLDVYIVLAGVVMLLFRNNAFYAAALAAVFMILFCGKKERLRILILCLLVVVGGKLGMLAIKGAIGTRFNAPPGEMFSVPVQQFARVGYMYGDTLDPETYALVDRYIEDEYWHGYMPALSDPMKNSATFYTVWLLDIPQLITDWVKVGLRYPNEYIDAFMELTRGYWFLDDTSFAEVLGSGLEERMGAIFTYNSSEGDFFEGVEHVSKFPWLESLLENIVSANQFYDWPVVSILFRAATYCWMLLLCFIIAFYTKNKKMKLLCLYPLMYLVTCLLGPVAWFRYIFPLVLITPIMIISPLLSKGECMEEKEIVD